MLVTPGVKGLVAIQHPWTRNALGKLFKLYNKMSKHKIEPSPKTITSILLYSILINCSSPMLERFSSECTKISKITLVLLNLAL